MLQLGHSSRAPRHVALFWHPFVPFWCQDVPCPFQPHCPTFCYKLHQNRMKNKEVTSVYSQLLYWMLNSFNDVTRQVATLCSDSFVVLLLNLMTRNTLLGMIVSWNWMGEEIFTFLRESKYSVSLITVPFCPVAPCLFQILAGVLIRL